MLLLLLKKKSDEFTEVCMHSRFCLCMYFFFKCMYNSTTVYAIPVEFCFTKTCKRSPRQIASPNSCTTDKPKLQTSDLNLVKCPNYP